MTKKKNIVALTEDQKTALADAKAVMETIDNLEDAQDITNNLIALGMGSDDAMALYNSVRNRLVDKDIRDSQNEKERVRRPAGAGIDCAGQLSEHSSGMHRDYPAGTDMDAEQGRIDKVLEAAGKVYDTTSRDRNTKAPVSINDAISVAQALVELADSAETVSEEKVTVEAKKPVEGLRYNSGKIQYSSLSPAAMYSEALVFAVGACKYKPNNWKSFKKTEEQAKQEFIDCALRHLMKIAQGEDIDPESHCLHASHIAWNVNRLVDLYMYGMTHGKDGKDLYHQPYRNQFPPVPTRANCKEIWGFEHFLDREEREKKGK